MKTTRAVRHEHGFTLIELLIVIAILAVLAALVIGAVAKRGRCIQRVSDAKAAISSCEGVLTNPDVDTVADCAKKAQSAITAFCNDGCSDPTSALQPLLDKLNDKINKYKETLSDADKAKISTVTKPC